MGEEHACATPDPAGATIACAVELYGLARILVGQKHVDVSLRAGATARDLLAAVAELHPQLAGRVLRPDLAGVTEGHSLSINGLAFVSDPGLVVLHDGDRLLILANAAGGSLPRRHTT
jgi:hypothetical protein